MSAARKKKIRGLLSPSKWDSDGQILETKVLTFDEDHFSMSKNINLSGLKDFISKFVEITGAVDVDKKEIKNLVKIKFIKNK